MRIRLALNGEGGVEPLHSTRFDAAPDSFPKEAWLVDGV